MNTPVQPKDPIGFNDLFKDELEGIHEYRNMRLGEGYSEKSSDNNPDDLQLMGLALSGGGIRSATFGLGILQALAEQGLLKYFDYLSTVSGGGYLGSWLTAWVMRETERKNLGIRKVEEDLKQSVNCKNQGAKESGVKECGAKDPREIPQIRFLREYSNFLTPQTGFFSGDTWTSITTYARNSSIIFLILVLAMAAVLLVPRMFILISPSLPEETDGWSVSSPGWAIFAVVFIIGLLFFAMKRIGRNLAMINQDKESQNPSNDSMEDDKTQIQRFVVLPLAVSAWLAGVIWLSLGGIQGKIPAEWCLVVGTVLYPSLCWLLPEQVWGQDREGGCNWLFRIFSKMEGCNKNRVRAIGYSIFAGIVGGLLLWSLAKWSVNANAAAVLVIIWGPPAMILVGLITVTIHVAFIGRYLGAEIHEWLLRLGGWLPIYTFGWVVLFLFALYSPFLFYTLEDKWVRSGLGLGWIVSTIAGILAGRSAQTGPKTGKSLLDWIATVAPFIFIVGLLSLISFGLHEWISDNSTKECFAKLASIRGSDGPCETWGIYWKSISNSGLSAAGWLLACIVLLLLFSKVDINLFSLHYYYRNRLIRCYLGASRSSSSDGRNPNPFTGFDGEDDPKLSKIWHKTGPYHIINTALNLVSGKNLAWQQRKASSFIFTPLVHGYIPDVEDVEKATPGKKDAAQQGYRRTDEKHSLGEAMAISGAAFSPNMGYHSSPAASFLMAIFNVRLGYWFRNPVKKPDTNFANLYYLILELLGLTNADKDFVYLSDGGHFENLGIYELVRRRCRYIVAVDAGQDGGFGFEDLGNAIRKCKVDLNTDIRINTASLRPKPDTQRSDRHCVMGTINYPATSESPNGRRGYLLYLKPNLSGDEPMDILEYAGSHPAFPHESTVDQWFDESQFESYRKLGYHIGKETLNTVMERELANPDLKHGLDMESIFAALRQFWFPPSPIGKEVFIKHGQALNDLMEQLRTTDELRFLDAEVYPGWSAMVETFEGVEKSKALKPSSLRISEAQGRGGFYFCNAMIQLAENVYSDLNLEDDWEHPDNRGWVNLFRQWAGSGMMRKTWAISAPTYGARFQVFCQERFGFPKQTNVELGAGIEIQVSNISKGIEDARKIGLLNDIEVGLIGAILRHRLNQPKIDPPNTIVIIPFQIVVPRLPGSTDGHHGSNLMQFPFGFALIVDDKIGYFRVQNHLRKAGLGRQALEELLFRHPLTGENRDVDLLEVPPDAFEVPTEPDMERFRVLYRSVRFTLGLKKTKKPLVF